MGGMNERIGARLLVCAANSDPDKLAQRKSLSADTG